MVTGDARICEYARPLSLSEDECEELSAGRSEDEVVVSESELYDADRWRGDGVRNTRGTRELGVSLGRAGGDDEDGGCVIRVGGWSEMVSRSSESGTRHVGQRPSEPRAPSQSDKCWWQNICPQQRALFGFTAASKQIPHTSRREGPTGIPCFPFQTLRERSGEQADGCSAQRATLGLDG